MSKLAALVTLALVGCATRATPPATVANTPPPRTAPAPAHEELRPLNWSGDMEKQVAIDGGVVTIGLVDHSPTVKIVRLEGARQTELFIAPLQIDGVPPQLSTFDYQIDPTANVDGATPDRFTLVGSVSESAQITYTVIWVFSWNPTRSAFDVAAPTVERHDNSVCLPCFS